MNLYQEIGLSVVIASGLIIGAIIAKNTIEEVKNGLKFIKIMMMGLFYLSVFLTTLTLSDNAIYAAFIPTLIILTIFYLPKNVFRFSKDYLFIIILAIVLSFSINESLNYAVSSVMFFNLICIGTLQYFHNYNSRNNKSMYISLLIKFLLFVVVTISLILINK